MIATALTLAATLALAASPDPSAPAAGEALVSPRPVPVETIPVEMIPAPGRWEVEDAPAYFGDRGNLDEDSARDIGAGVAAGHEVADSLPGDPAAAVAAEGEPHDVALAPDRRGAAVPLPRPRDLAAPLARP